MDENTKEYKEDVDNVNSSTYWQLWSLGDDSYKTFYMNQIVHFRHNILNLI